MNTKTIAVVLAASCMVLFSSCDKDEEVISKPVINGVELGTSNSHIGIIGSDLHVEAEVTAKAKINKIEVLIHQEDNDNAWTFDRIYTEFRGLKNTTFHKHIDIPLTVADETYCFHFIVTDESGQQSSIEIEDLTIQTPSDAVAPTITITSTPTNNQSFASGQTIRISGSVSDDIALGGIYIGLVRVDQGLTDAEVNDGNSITLLHNHDFTNPTSYSFSANIVVGTALDNNITPKTATWTSGDYYIVVKSKDSFGGNWAFSGHYPIVIN
ncbi:MAG: DUF4625 domain-containing protein [Bacteroidales bacterium]|nr:DUF4625 domain-containing protein [Bacteroidales bacterium]MDD4822745.1 DUF4625 domain-containing protein [Bacteroidales bacterium]